MKVFKGLTHQKGYGILGSLLKFGVPIVGGLLGELAGGFINKKIQKGSGLGDVLKAKVAQIDSKIRGAARRGTQSLYDKAMRATSGKANLQDAIQALGNTGLDFINKKKSLAQGLRHYGTHALKLTGNRLLEQKLNPILSKPIVGSILRKTVMPIVRGKVNTAIEGAVQKFRPERKRSSGRSVEKGNQGSRSYDEKRH